MNQTQIVIISNKQDDAHTDAFIRFCQAENCEHEVIRVNTEDFLENVEMVFQDEEYDLQLKDSGKRIRSKEIRSVWYRRPQSIHVPSALSEDPGVKRFVEEQTTAFLRGFYFSTHKSARWVNPLPALHQARHKLPQLQLARRLGMKIPRTLVTNRPEEAIAFAESCERVCIKSLDQPNFTLGGRVSPWLTRPITLDDLWDQYDSIRCCPVFFQEFIRKAYDIRVIVFQDHVSAFAIDSQTTAAAVNDFRGVSPHLLPHEAHFLPEPMIERILMFVKEQDLLFSALDFILTPEGEYIFLENNPNGQWLWLESLTGVKLMEQIKGLLFW